MKYLLKKLSLVIVILSISSCSVESIDNELTEQSFNEPIEQNVVNNYTCTDANPEARFVNNGTIAFDFKIYDSNMVLLGDFQNVTPGSTTNWTSFNEGQLLFTVDQVIEPSATIVSDQKLQINLNNCSTLDVTVGPNNVLLDNPAVDI